MQGENILAQPEAQKPNEENTQTSQPNRIVEEKRIINPPPPPFEAHEQEPSNKNTQRKSNRGSTEDDDSRPKSPLSVAAMRSLGYEMKDLTRRTREEVAASERENLARVPSHRIAEYIDMKMKHIDSQISQRLSEIKEARKNMSMQDQSMNGSLKKGEQSSMASSRHLHSAQGKEAIYEKEKVKMEKMKERSKKQIEYLIKEQEEAQEIQRRGMAKQEKIEAMEKRKQTQAEAKAQLAEEERRVRELKNIEAELAKQSEQEELFRMYEKKQDLLKVRLEDRHAEHEKRKVKNEEIREKFEQRITLNRQQQEDHINLTVKEFEKKEIDIENKRRLFQEKIQEKFEQRRGISEQKRVQIQEQLEVQERENELKRQQLIRKQSEKEKKIQASKSIEDVRRNQVAAMRQDKSEFVKSKFERSAQELQLRLEQDELQLKDGLQRAEERRIRRIEEEGLKSFQHKLHIEEIQTQAQRIEKQHQALRDSIFAKIQFDTQKMQVIQAEKQQLARFKEKIQADNNKKKQETLAIIAQVQQSKLAPLHFDENNRSISSSHSASALNSSRFTGLRSPQEGSASKQAKPHNSGQIKLQPFNNQTMKNNNSLMSSLHAPMNSHRSGGGETSSAAINGNRNSQSTMALDNNNRGGMSERSYQEVRQTQSVHVLANQQANHNGGGTATSTVKSENAPKRMDSRGEDQINRSNGGINGAAAATTQPQQQQQSQLPQHKGIDLTKLKGNTNNGAISSRMNSTITTSKQSDAFISPRGKILQQHAPSTMRQTISYMSSYGNGAIMQSKLNRIIGQQSATGSNNSSAYAQEKTKKVKKSKTDFHSNKQIKELFSKEYVEDVRQVQKIIAQDLFLIMSKELLFFSRTGSIEDDQQRNKEQEKVIDRLTNSLHSVYDKHEVNAAKFHSLYSFFYKTG